MTKNGIKSVIDKTDPIGLLALHCPKDEYDIEAEMIFTRIRENMTAGEISDIIHAVFLETFNESIGTKPCNSMAQEILLLAPWSHF